jgi:regulator of sigma E protease
MENPMNEQNPTQTQDSQPQPSKINHLINSLLVLVVLCGAVWLGIQNPGMTWKILQVALGFGAVIMIHELGHFLVAKLCGIKIEMFSIGFPPVLLSLKKTKQGVRVRILPHASADQAVAEEDDGTEYCIGLLPFGGFVKMMGQSDTGTVEKTDDKRSFLNKPIWQRIAVVAAGVIFNAVGAMILFMALFSHGLELTPPIVGEVTPNSPADVAGLKAGDRIVEINGEKFVDYMSVVLAAALSDNDHTVKMKVEKSDGSIADIKLMAEKLINDTSGLRAFGIAQPTTLMVSRYIKDPGEIDTLYKSTGFRPNDVITAMNGKPLAKPWQLDEYASSALTPLAALTVSRSFPKGSDNTSMQIEVPMVCGPNYPNFRTEFDLANVYSMVPRLKIAGLGEFSEPTGYTHTLKLWFNRIVLRKPVESAIPKPKFKAEDIVIQIGDVSNPTYKDLRDQTIANKDKPLSVTVLRKNEEGQLQPVTFEVTPSAKGGDSNRVILDVVPIIPLLDMEHAVVARTIDSTLGPGALPIPSGAQITSVDGQAVKSFYDVIRLIRQSSGQRISIEYKLGQDAGGTGLDVPEQDAIHMQSEMLLTAPLEFYKETYKAKNPAQAVAWGVKRTWQFIEQSIFTLTGLFSGNVPASSLSGPVGIATISYKMAGQGIMDLLNFLGLLSACLVVMNLLPLPIVDGGVILLLIIEKIRGVPLNPKILEIITWIGLILLLSVFVWVTYNDVLRL